MQCVVPPPPRPHTAAKSEKKTTLTPEKIIILIVALSDSHSIFSWRFVLLFHSLAHCNTVFHLRETELKQEQYSKTFGVSS